MTDMPPATRCPACGRELPADSPAGLCADCLLRQGLAGLDADVADGPHSPTRLQPAGFVPPSPESLAPLFPQLEIIEVLGHGGMGAVYRARQTKLDRFVALKIIRPEAAADPAFAERFNREARTLARMAHPNIVGVYDFGEVTLPAGSRSLAVTSNAPGTLYYFVMEYVDGANLRQVMQAGQLAPAEALKIVPQICEALQYAHDEGIVHRDIKPENILLDQRGKVKIADFGLAKLAATSREQFTLTGTHQVMGTPRYMAPEQMEGSHAVDHRADIYSLGVVFYEMLTGRVPAGHFEPPSKAAPVDERVDQVVLRALARDPAARFQSVSELKSNVEAISQVAAAALPVPHAASAPARGASTILERQFSGLWEWVGGAVKDPASASTRPIAPAMPSLWMVVLAFLVCGLVVVPWFDVRITDQDVIRGIDGTQLTVIGNRPTHILEMPGVRMPSGMLVAFVMGLFGVICLATSSSRPVSFWRAALLTLLAGGATAGIVVSRASVEDQYFTFRYVSPDGSALDGVPNTRPIHQLERETVPRWPYYAGLAMTLVLAALSALGMRHAVNAPADRSPREEATGPRYSRMAIVGAVMIGLWLTALVVPGMLVTVDSQVVVDGSSDQPVAHSGKLVPMLALFAVGTVPLLVSSLLGWLAIGSIRASNGRLVGLGLATFDALFAPLVLLNGAILFASVSSFVDSFETDGMSGPFGRALAGSIVCLLPVDALIVYGVWRLASLPRPANTGSTPAFPHTTFWFSVLALVVLTALLGFATVVSGTAWVLTTVLVPWFVLGIFAESTDGKPSGRVLWRLLYVAVPLTLALIGWGMFFAQSAWPLLLIPGVVAAVLGGSWAGKAVDKDAVAAATAEQKAAGAGGKPSSDSLYSLRFTVPRDCDVFGSAVFHFSSFGYEVAERTAEACVLQRGGNWAGLYETDFRKYHTTLTIRTLPTGQDRQWVSCHWSVRTLGAWVTKKDLRLLEQEGQEFQAFLSGESHDSTPTPLGTTPDRSPSSESASPVSRVAQFPGPGESVLDSANAADVSGPAVGLMIAGAVTFLSMLSAVLICLSNSFDDETAWIGAPGLVLGIIMVLGGWAMHGGKSREWAWAGVFAAATPISPTWWLTVPIGIWAGRTLKRPEVKQAFAQSAARPPVDGVSVSRLATRMGLWTLAALVIGFATYDWHQTLAGYSYSFEDRSVSELAPRSHTPFTFSIVGYGSGISATPPDMETVPRTRLEVHASTYGGYISPLEVTLPELGYRFEDHESVEVSHPSGLNEEVLRHWLYAATVSPDDTEFDADLTALLRTLRGSFRQPILMAVNRTRFEVRPGLDLGNLLVDGLEWSEHAMWCVIAWCVGLVVIVGLTWLATVRSWPTGVRVVTIVTVSGLLLLLAIFGPWLYWRGEDLVPMLNGRNFGDSPLVVAVCRGNEAETRELLARRVFDDQGHALLWAAGLGNRDNVLAILKAGTDVDSASHFGITPLMLASALGNIEIVQLLIDAGADVNARDTGSDVESFSMFATDAPRQIEYAWPGDQQSPLILAIREGHAAIAALLIKSGARLEQADGTGTTARAYAAASSRAEIRNLLTAEPAAVTSEPSAQTSGTSEAP